jgi:predicted DNA-binding transcriptional regulator AlpA
MRKRIPTTVKSNISRRERRAEASKRTDVAAEQSRLVTGPVLRKMLCISAPTLWRWRHREETGFPAAKSINGRLFFNWQEVQAWLDRQPVAA